MSFSTAIQHPEVQLNVLALISLPKLARGFATDGTYTNLGKMVWAVQPYSLSCEGPSVNVTLSHQTSVASVNTTPNSWYWDGTTLWVNVGGSFATIWTHYVQVFVNLYASTRPVTYDGFDYEARILSAPAISMRIERRFGAPVQVGGGQLRLATADGRWDKLESWNWEAATVSISVEITTAGETASAALASFGVEAHAFSDTDLSLTLRDKKRKLDGRIPTTVFDSSTYPTIAPGLLGKPIPVAYGRILSVEPICTDATTKTFKLAGHAIYSLEGVRIQADAGWRWTTPTAIDLANATFTLGSDWTGSEVVCCDFTGKKNVDGTPMLNPVDILKDVLTLAGASSFGASFTTAKAAMETLTDEDGRPAPIRQVAIYLRDARDVFDVLKDLCEWCGLYLYTDSGGSFVVGAWQPARSEGATTFDETSILTFSADSSTLDAGTTQRVTYENRPSEGFNQSTVESRSVNRYTTGVFSQVTDDMETGLVWIGDARALGQTMLFMLGQGETVWSITVPWCGWMMVPGGVCRLSYSARHSISTVAEVLDVNYDLGRGTARLVLGPQRNFSGRAGFWVADSDVLPTRFAALAGYGAGSLAWNKDWHADIKTWAKENVGYWTDENGFADSTDPDSYIPSSWS